MRRGVLRRTVDHITAVDDVDWVRDTLNREGERFGTRVEVGAAGDLELRWT